MNLYPIIGPDIAACLSFDNEIIGPDIAAYLSFNNSDIAYFSDTGRTWSNEQKVKDYLPSASEGSAGGRKAVVTSTDGIIELIKNGQLGHAYLLVHPERWSDNIVDWTVGLLWDTGVNMTKRILSLRKVPIDRRNGTPDLPEST